MTSAVSVAEALRRVLASARPTAVESIPVHAALGRVLANDLHARWDVPGDNVSVMDGYAVRCADLTATDLVSGPLRVMGESAAGHPSFEALQATTTCRISTGARLPQGADTVVPQEDVSVVDGTTIRVDLQRYGAPQAGRWVRRAGCDLRVGDVALLRGFRLGAAELALAAVAGHDTLCVHARPRVSIVTTGDELVPVGQAPAPGETTSSNELLLSLLAGQWGAQIQRIDHAPDHPDRLFEQLQAALDAEVVISCGGISVGRHDHVFEAWQRAGCAFDVRGIQMRPGRPTSFGSVDSTLIFALPGNPASTFVAASLFVRPALRRMLGVRGNLELPKTTVVLANDAHGAGPRAHWLRAALLPNGHAQILPDQRSGNLRSFSGAHALIEVPANIAHVPRGTAVEAYLLDPWWTENTASS